ncbi:AraC family transcriptional regulator [Cellulosilyticum sp. I15G10I2]|uniref:AraC family transcriptional regulator n=1 Tax=Cellulosilyticum sp. I15G10I2 TaxID=1892843 RepID=UPI00085BCB50|nr:AraC family transcriptional regulator [Cellulosilyticum sp. I15G10I2]
MSLHLEVNRLNLTDLMMYQCGYEACAPSHAFGPAVRDHFLIHYVLSGKGTFHANNTIYTLEKGQGFLICPDAITFYEADASDPWTYAWVGFHGLKAAGYLEAAGLTQKTPILSLASEGYITHCFKEMLETQKLKVGRELRLLGILYTLLSELIEISPQTLAQPSRRDRKEYYLQTAIQYIERNYSRKITITELSRHIGLDRSYLCHLFKELLSKSPQQFLIDYRMNKAVELMHNPLLSLGDIARSVGYSDVLCFSKAFTKTHGIAPSHYRKNTI